MDYLHEINESLLNLRQTNKLLKQKLAESGHELQKLKDINLDQGKRILHLESLIGSDNNNYQATDECSFKHVINDAKHSAKVHVLDTCDPCGANFERAVTELAQQAVRVSFADYSEVADYLKQEIRARTGTECLVTCGQVDTYGYKTWMDKNRKYIALKIGIMVIVVNQINTKFTDVLQCAKSNPSVDILHKSEQIDVVFEERVLELAKHIVQSTTFKSSLSIADFMKDELVNKYGKVYGSNWLVTVGVGKYYDLSYSVKGAKQRKFLDFIINELRFTVFQTL